MNDTKSLFTQTLLLLYSTRTWGGWRENVTCQYLDAAFCCYTPSNPMQKGRTLIYRLVRTLFVLFRITLVLFLTSMSSSPAITSIGKVRNTFSMLPVLFTTVRRFGFLSIMTWKGKWV